MLHYVITIGPPCKRAWRCVYVRRVRSGEVGSGRHGASAGDRAPRPGVARRALQCPRQRRRPGGA